MAERLVESSLYPPVARWLTRAYGCFATASNVGTRYGRIDVAGIRDLGGDLSGRAEVISIEVKAGRQPFASAAGQARGYAVYAERVYLADVRVTFSREEIAIASSLEIGLIALSEGGRCREVLTAPVHSPIEGMRLQLIEKMHHSQCTICSSVFERGDAGNWKRHVVRGGADDSRLARRQVLRAIAEEKGLVYWINEVGSRQENLRDVPRGGVRHRRYICPDCVITLFAPEGG